MSTARRAGSPVVRIAHPEHVSNYAAVTPEVAEILAKAEIIKPGSLKMYGQSMLSDYVTGHGMTWSDVLFCVGEAEVIVKTAREDLLRKRLLGAI